MNKTTIYYFATTRWETTDLVKYHQINDRAQPEPSIVAAFKHLNMLQQQHQLFFITLTGKATSEFLEVLEYPTCGTDGMHSILPHELTTTTM
jgi:hypothetical protein